MVNTKSAVSKRVSTETACCNGACYSARNSKTQVRRPLVRKPVRAESAIYSGLPKGPNEAPMRIRMGGMPTLTGAEINIGRLAGIRFSL